MNDQMEAMYPHDPCPDCGHLLMAHSKPDHVCAACKAVGPTTMNHRSRLRRKRQDQLVSLRALVVLEAEACKTYGGSAWEQDPFLLGSVTALEFVLHHIDERLAGKTAG